MKKILVLLLALILVTGLLAKSKTDFPKKPITVICPWSAGGGTDTILRALSKEAEKSMGQTITVVNQTGGGGAVGHAAIMKAKPDGYTVGMITFELNSLPPQGLIPFTFKDFDPIMRINTDGAALTVPIDAPYNSVKEFVEYAKAHPGEITIGNSGPGSVWHIAAGLLAEKTGIDVKYVPYDGAAPAVTALIGGHIKAVSVSVAEVQSQVKSGLLKIIGVMDTKRADLFPDVPTFKEQGYDVVMVTWRGLALPKKVPANVRKIIIDAYKKGFDSQDFKDFAKKVGLGLAYLDDKAFKSFLDSNAKSVEATMVKLGLAKKK
jgi:tripartite-type tricarboxylate transporter receptor subunit TctC